MKIELFLPRLQIAGPEMANLDCVNLIRKPMITSNYY